MHDHDHTLGMAHDHTLGMAAAQCNVVNAVYLSHSGHRSVEECFSEVMFLGVDNALPRCIWFEFDIGFFRRSY